MSHDPISSLLTRAGRHRTMAAAARSESLSALHIEMAEILERIADRERYFARSA